MKFNKNIYLPEKLTLEFYYSAEMDSSNERLKEMLLQTSLPECSVCYCDFQQAGRGTGKNLWESESGKNLLFSILLKPKHLKADQQFALNQAISLGVLDFILLFVPHSPVKIKWPNDMYIGNEKIAGILIENSIVENTIQQSIVGIGINIFQTTFEWAPEATSLLLHRKELPGLDDLLLKVIQCILVRYKSLEFPFHAIVKAYHEALYRRGEMTKFLMGNHNLHAKIMGVNEYGQLKLLTENSEELLCNFKEIVFLP